MPACMPETAMLSINFKGGGHMTIVIKEIEVKTKVEKTVLKPEMLSGEVWEKLKRELLKEMVRHERRKPDGGRRAGR